MNIYCLNCRSKTSTKDAHQFLNAHGKPMAKGSCSKCGRTQVQLLSKKTGGFVFTLPMLAAAAAVAGSLAGGASSVANAVNQKKTADKQLAEKVRHNKAMQKKATAYT